MKIKVLGTMSPYPKGDKNGPGFLITNNKTNIILDCGSGISRLLNFPDDLNNLHIIISHLHKDHYADLFSFGYANQIHKKLGSLANDINVYIPKYNEGDESYTDYQFIKNSKEDKFILHEYDEKTILDIADFKITFLKMAHGIKTYGCKIECAENTVVYTADTGYEIKPKLAAFASNVDLLICESSFIKEHNSINNYHLHAHESAAIAGYANVKKLLLTHFWPETPKELYLKEAKEIFDNTEVAEEEKVYMLES